MTSPGGLIRVMVGFLERNSDWSVETTSSPAPIFPACGFAPGRGGCACAHAGASGNVKLVTLGAVRGILSTTALGAIKDRSGDSTSGKVSDERSAERLLTSTSAERLGASQVDVERTPEVGCQSDI